MACNLNEDRKYDRDGTKPSGLGLDGSESQEQLSPSTTTTSKQNGDQAGCEDEQMSEQDAGERRKSGLSDMKNCSTSPSALHRSAEEWSRKTFQIPRKIKERKGCVPSPGIPETELGSILALLHGPLCMPANSTNRYRLCLVGSVNAAVFSLTCTSAGLFCTYVINRQFQLFSHHMQIWAKLADVS